jgi:hypothetical protein
MAKLESYDEFSSFAGLSAVFLIFHEDQESGQPSERPGIQSRSLHKPAYISPGF